MTTKWNPSDAQERQGVAITEQIIAKIGHIFREQETNDVGIDAHVELVDEKSHEATGQLVALQIKGGPSFFKEATVDAFIFRGEMKHLDYWLNHSLPVFLVLVDTAKQQAFWQEISQVTTERLDKGWKVAVPFTQDLETNFVVAARERVGLDANASSYTRLTLHDTSNTGAKRYAAKILMRPPVTRLRAEAIVRRATADIRKERYHHSDHFRALFRNHDADVVSLYVAGELNDAENANWYCRTIWMAKDLAAGVRPVGIGGVDFGDGLEIVWEMDYETASQFYKGLQVDKQEFLMQMKGFIAYAETFIENSFGNGKQSICSPEVMTQYAVLMRNLYIESNDIGVPPYECADVAERFGDVMTFADNAFIYALKMGEEPQNGGWAFLLETALKDYRKNLDRLRYELEKIR